MIFLVQGLKSSNAFKEQPGQAIPGNNTQSGTNFYITYFLLLWQNIMI